MKYTINLLAAILAVTALGQTGNSTISGSVKDPAAAAIPGAKIKITNVESGATIESVSNEAGLYRVGTLLPGNYRVTVDAGFKAFATDRVGGYERLLMDAIAGRLNLFVRTDEQEQAWRWVEPIIEAWNEARTPPKGYTAGSWGPAASSALLSRDAAAWHEEM